MVVLVKDLKDRTAEFRAITNALRKRQASLDSDRGKQQQLQRQTNAVSPKKKSEFTTKAKFIARDISETTELLEELGNLSRKRTVFEDFSQDINMLTGRVKMNIAKINGSIRDLQATVYDGNAGGKQLQQHNSNVVILLQSQLANTSNVFKDVLETRRENLFEVNSRRDRLLVGKTTSALESQGSESYLKQRSNAFRDSQFSPSIGGSGTSSTIVAENKDEFVALSLPTFGQEQSQLLLAEQQDTYLESRSNAISSIESTIAELGGIFQQLSQMVAEQSDVVQRIDSQTEQIQANISGAHTELLRYYSNLMSNRWLMVQVFLVLIVTVFLFVIFS